MNDKRNALRIDRRWLAVLALAFGITAVPACSGETGDPEPAFALGDLSAQCPGKRPADPPCGEVWCNKYGDAAWDYKMRPVGYACGQHGSCDGQGMCVEPPPPPPPPMLSNKPFFISALGNRCVDIGPASAWGSRPPVTSATCTSSFAQQVWIREIDGTHDVELRSQSGSYCVGVRGGRVGTVDQDQPLELQACNGSPSQRFAIDGDSLLMGLQQSGTVSREFAVAPMQGRTAEGTPLVVQARRLEDGEYFRFRAVDGSPSRPTSGFVRVSDGPTLTALLGSATTGWGTVIELDEQRPILVSAATPMTLPAGVTLRGYRKGRSMGPEIRISGYSEQATFTVDSHDVRVTGLRIRGNADVASSGIEQTALRAFVTENARVLFDHLDVGYMTGHAIDVRQAGVGGPAEETCTATANPRPEFVRAQGNFLHDNRGYAVVTGTGAFIIANGNTMYRNRHYVTADPWAQTGYVANDNFLLSATSNEHIFDMHGSLDSPHWQGGRAGDYFDVGWNTVLAIDEPEVNLRGTPCRHMYFHDNVLRRASSGIIDSNEIPSRTILQRNAYGVDPMTDLGVGDFDGDGTDDVFIGTGVGWYFSSGGQGEWRHLSRKNERASQLRFGDFDGDRRTDVIALHGTGIDVSWAGTSAWMPLNTLGSGGYTIADLAVGDFDGDRRADVFFATGTKWRYAPGGVGWTYRAVSSFRTPSLRFGDFDGDHRTDVLGVVGGAWKIVPASGETWTAWRDALTSSLSDLVVADLDGDGTSDVAGTISGSWRYSKSARGNWTTLQSSSTPLARVPVGRFDDDSKTDVLVYDGEHFAYASGGSAPLTRWSRQMMR